MHVCQCCAACLSPCHIDHICAPAASEFGLVAVCQWLASCVVGFEVALSGLIESWSEGNQQSLRVEASQQPSQTPCFPTVAAFQHAAEMMLRKRDWDTAAHVAMSFALVHVDAAVVVLQAALQGARGSAEVFQSVAQDHERQPEDKSSLQGSSNMQHLLAELRESVPKFDPLKTEVAEVSSNKDVTDV